MKEAITKYTIHPVLAKRWSPRSFDPKPIETKKLQSLLEAARWSPSANNKQPWHIFVGQKEDETYKLLFNSLVEFNQMWAGSAPVLLMVCAEKEKLDNGEFSKYPWYDCGQAMAHLSFQAMADGLYVHQMAGLIQQKVKDSFHLPDNFEVISIIAIGYLGKADLLHPRMQKPEIAKRERKIFDSFVFEKTFGQISNLIE